MADAIDLIAFAWLACKPLVDLRNRANLSNASNEGAQHLVAALPEAGKPAVG
jgi:hypothetical protein